MSTQHCVLTWRALTMLVAHTRTLACVQGRARAVRCSVHPLFFPRTKVATPKRNVVPTAALLATGCYTVAEATSILNRNDTPLRELIRTAVAKSKTNRVLCSVEYNIAFKSSGKSSLADTVSQLE